MKIKSILLINFLILATQNTSFSAGKCFRQYTSVDNQFIKYPEDAFMAFRSNAPHYWGFTKSLSEDPRFQTLFKVKGIGVGDFHFLNVADIELRNHQRQIGLIDLDDAGVNIPLLPDMARQLVALSLTPAKDEMPNYVKAFFHGVKGTPTSSSFIKDILKKSSEDFNKKFEKMMRKYVSPNNRFSEDSGIKPISDGPSSVVQLFQNIETTFIEALRKYDSHFKVLDFGFRIKSDGGSQGIPRFVYLIEKTNGEIEIIEFKQYIKSAASEYDLQGPNKERFESVKKTYRPADAVFGLFELIEKENLFFIARTKLPNFIDFKVSDNMSKNDKENLQDFIAYSLNLYGLAQRNQLTYEQIKWLTENKEIIEQQLLEFIKLYTKELYYQNTKEKK